MRKFPLSKRDQIILHIKPQNELSRCILDGEMLVWDTQTNRFAEFGSNQEIGLIMISLILNFLKLYLISISLINKLFSAKAARDGLERHRQVVKRFVISLFHLLRPSDTVDN